MREQETDRENTKLYNIKPFFWRIYLVKKWGGNSFSLSPNNKNDSSEKVLPT